MNFIQLSASLILFVLPSALFLLTLFNARRSGNLPPLFYGMLFMFLIGNAFHKSIVDSFGNSLISENKISISEVTKIPERTVENQIKTFDKTAKTVDDTAKATKEFFFSGPNISE